MISPLWRRAAAELLGTGLLVTVVVGSGIAAQLVGAALGLALLALLVRAPRARAADAIVPERPLT